MLPICHATFVFLLVVCLCSARAFAQETVWTDGSSLEVEGKGWADTKGAFDRLPDSAEDKFNPTAWDLSKHSAGLCVRFRTDAPSVSVRWSLTSEALDMPHMPATGVSGVDLYARHDSGPWRFIGNGRPAGKDGNTATFAFPDGIKPPRVCLLYLPLYNGTASLEIGVPEGSVLEKAPPRPLEQRKPLVVYGTSVTQGGCASRPGMAWPAMLGRLLNRPVINLGFSGSGRMETTVGDVLAELDPAAYLISCTWNMGDSQEVYNERVPALVHALRKEHARTPIIFVGQSLIHPEAHPTDLSRRLENAIGLVRGEGVEGITFIPGEHLIGYDSEATVDGVHLTDLGMDRQARCLLPTVKLAVEGGTPGE